MERGRYYLRYYQIVHFGYCSRGTAQIGKEFDIEFKYGTLMLQASIVYILANDLKFCYRYQKNRLSMKQSVTIYDIAKAAGCSPMTVSRALKRGDEGGGHLHRKLRYERIRRIAQQLNYRPNPAARALSHRRTGQIGFCINSPAHNYYHPYQFYILSSLKKRLFELGYQLGFHYFDPSNPEDFRAFLQPPCCCDAIAFWGGAWSEKAINDVRRQKMHAVSLRGEVRGIASVTVNEYRGGQLAAEAFHRLGHRKVGMLWRFRGINEPRIKGFLDRAAELGLKIPGSANIPLFATPETESINNQNEFLFEQEAVRGIKTLLRRKTGISGVYISSDFIAFPIVRYLDSARVEIGRDLSVVSFDDFESLGVQPWKGERLASVHIPRTDIGKVAAELLVDALNLGNAPSVSLEPTFTLRESLGTP